MARKIMREFRLDEISAVDRPAQKHAKVVLMKRDFSSDERDNAAETGSAMPDGSFPIENKGDLANAIRAIGRAKDPAAARAHITRRAKALGCPDMLPENWTQKADKEPDPYDPNEGDEGEDEEGRKPGNPVNRKEKPMADEAKKVAELEAQIADLTKARDDAVAKVAELTKAADIAKADETFVADGQTIRKSEVGESVFNFMKAQAEKIEINEFAKKADAEIPYLPGESTAKANVLRSVSRLPEDVAKAVNAMLAAGNAAMKSVTAEKGHGLPGYTKADDELNGLVEAHATAHKVTKAAAYDAVLQTADGRRLYAEAEAEKKRAA